VQNRQTNLLESKRDLRIDLLRSQRELLTLVYLRSASTPSPCAGRAVTFLCKTWWIGSSRPTSSVLIFCPKARRSLLLLSCVTFDNFAYHRAGAHAVGDAGLSDAQPAPGQCM
jgi:hypothetical protein